MTPPTITVDDRLDREIRATLHRHAGDVEPRPPEWDELIERADSVIVSLPRGDGIETRRGDDRRRWARPVAAAAAVLVVLAAAAVLADTSPSAQTTGEPNRGPLAAPQTEPPITGPVIPVPGDPNFDPAVAHPVYPLDDRPDAPDVRPEDDPDQRDPRALATKYLADRLGVPESSVEVGEAAVTAGPPGDLNVGSTATAPWSTRSDAEGPTTVQGTVFLQQYNSDAGWVWAVVGATTEGLRLTEVRRDETAVSFVIDRREDPRSDPVAVSILTGAGAGEQAVAVPGAEQISDRAWLVDVESGGRLTVSVPVEASSDVRIALGHVGGRWLSIVEMAPTLTSGEVCDIACTPAE